MYIYKKIYINDSGGYEIHQYYPNGSFRRRVDEDHHDYLAWLELNNAPEEVAYVAPPPSGPQPPSVEERVELLQSAVDFILMTM